jgi:hypothetical protein
MWDFSRLPLVGGGAFPGGGIFSRNYEEFSTGVDRRILGRSKSLSLLVQKIARHRTARVFESLR